MFRNYAQGKRKKVIDNCTEFWRHQTRWSTARNTALLHITQLQFNYPSCKMHLTSLFHLLEYNYYTLFGQTAYTSFNATSHLTCLIIAVSLLSAMQIDLAVWWFMGGLAVLFSQLPRKPYGFRKKMYVMKCVFWFHLTTRNWNFHFGKSSARYH